MGRLIAIEGIDGSGKGTQSQMLVSSLNKSGFKAKLYSFPAYDSTFFGKEIGAFLRGEYGQLNAVHPKLAALLFASDRLELKKCIEEDLANGFYVICDRYVGSNVAHQAAKLKDADFEDFATWVQTLEYEIFGLPRPDKVIFLDVPVSVSKDLVLRKKQRVYTADAEDLHESDHTYMAKVYAAYKRLSISSGWDVITCVEHDHILSMEDISNQLTRLISVEKTGKF
ncbi:dTMP kinase [Thalassolituus sp. C2-1]|uniref:dTMP kinase n=1 Tax=Venatorbacter sp. C2-1 TaxID=2597518 RepID=UPI001192FC17|nr:dTMP kinase [Thalassolituus sp. C2-1]TVV45416.1 dTMP kinase [Thalassolituus sp. C2-1]